MNQNRLQLWKAFVRADGGVQAKDTLGKLGELAAKPAVVIEEPYRSAVKPPVGHK
jgi:hypothetical protein